MLTKDGICLTGFLLVANFYFQHIFHFFPSLYYRSIFRYSCIKTLMYLNNFSQGYQFIIWYSLVNLYLDYHTFFLFRFLCTIFIRSRLDGLDDLFFCSILLYFKRMQLLFNLFFILTGHLYTYWINSSLEFTLRERFFYNFTENRCSMAQAVYYVVGFLFLLNSRFYFCDILT